MSRTQIIILVVAIALAAGMFLLPKVVVTKDDSTAAGQTSALPEGHSEDDGHDHGSAPAAAEGVHNMATPDQLLELATVRTRYNKATDPKTRGLLAGELGAAYATASKFDSAGYYFELAAEARPGEKNYRKAGDQYFEAFTYAATQQRAGEMGGKARKMYEQVLRNNPSDLDAKTNVAMTYIATDNPMQGITLLREVITEDPKNQKALFNLGILSVQSGQWDKAAERFEELVQVNANHVEGTFYLAVSLAETGKKQQAIEVFNKVKTMSSDPALTASVDEYLAKL